MLAQQIVAEVAARDWEEAALYERLRRAWPFRRLAREDFDAVVRMLAEGFTTRRGRNGALIHRDGVHHILRGRRGARTTALTSGGTIPDTADYRVLLEPENNVIGTVHEDFAVESMAGDIFQLGNRSYRIQRVERGTVRVEDTPMDSHRQFRSGSARRRAVLTSCHRRCRACASTLRSASGLIRPETRPAGG